MASREEYRAGVDEIRKVTDEAKPVAVRGAETVHDKAEALKRGEELLKQFGTHIAAAAGVHTEFGGLIKALEEEFGAEGSVVQDAKRLAEQHNSATKTFNETVGTAAHPIIEQEVRPPFGGWKEGQENLGIGITAMGTALEGLRAQFNERQEALDGLNGAVGTYYDTTVQPVVKGLDVISETFGAEAGAIQGIDQGLLHYKGDALQ